MSDNNFDLSQETQDTIKDPGYEVGNVENAGEVVGNRIFNQAATRSVTNAYFSQGADAATAAANDFSTGAKGLVGQGLNFADSAKGGGIIGGDVYSKETKKVFRGAHKYEFGES